MDIQKEIKRTERRIKFNLCKMKEQVQRIKRHVPKVEALLGCDGGEMFYTARVHVNLINSAVEEYNRIYLETGELNVKLSRLRLKLAAA